MGFLPFLNLNAGDLRLMVNNPVVGLQKNFADTFLFTFIYILSSNILDTHFVIINWTFR